MCRFVQLATHTTGREGLAHQRMTGSDWKFWQIVTVTILGASRIWHAGTIYIPNDAIFPCMPHQLVSELPALQCATTVQFMCATKKPFAPLAIVAPP